MNALRRGVLATAPFICLAAACAAACASIADLDVQYPDGASAGGEDAGADGPRHVRESTFDASRPDVAALEPGPMTPCLGEAGLGEEGCDETAGLGCCIKASSSSCIQQWQLPTECAGDAGDVFIACRRGNGDSACCWRPTPNGNGQFAVYAGDCDGGGVACVDDADCPSEGPLAGCKTTTCPSVEFAIGQCGTLPKCPVAPTPGDQ